jgi:hypothetical protein
MEPWNFFVTEERLGEITASSLLSRLAGPLQNCVLRLVLLGPWALVDPADHSKCRKWPVVTSQRMMEARSSIPHFTTTIKLTALTVRDTEEQIRLDTEVEEFITCLIPSGLR